MAAHSAKIQVTLASQMTLAADLLPTFAHTSVTHMAWP
jgi:hypothetical protein